MYIGRVDFSSAVFNSLYIYFFLLTPAINTNPVFFYFFESIWFTLWQVLFLLEGI